jgi:DNA ligase (NAD+)
MMNSFNYVPCVCPVCNSKLVWEGTDLYCKNPDCGKKRYEDIYRWIQVVGQTDNINGAGNSLLDSIIKHFGWNTPSDIYEGKIEKVKDGVIDGVGPSKVKILNAILDKLVSPIAFSDFLVGLNIKGLSYKLAENIAENSNLEEALKSNSVDIYSLKFDSRVSRTVVSELKANISYIKRMYDLTAHKGTEKERKAESAQNSVEKMKVCVTGKLNGFTSRKKFFTSYAPYIIESSVESCNYLVCNDKDSGSSKIKYALSHGVKVISENEFYAMIEK